MNHLCIRTIILFKMTTLYTILIHYSIGAKPRQHHPNSTVLLDVKKMQVRMQAEYAAKIAHDAQDAARYVGIVTGESLGIYAETRYDSSTLKIGRLWQR